MKRHPFDPVSLVFGLLLVGFALMFLVGKRTAADIAPMMIWAVPLIALGALAVTVGILRVVRVVHEPPGETEAEPPDA